MVERKTSYDSRLIGTWKSDRRLTLRHWKPKAGCPPESEIKLKGLFGKLIVRWGRSRYHTVLDGRSETHCYEVIARVSTSVVIRIDDRLLGQRLQQIHYCGDHYRLVAGTLIEYFRRVPKPPSDQSN